MLSVHNIHILLAEIAFNVIAHKMKHENVALVQGKMERAHK